LAADFVFMGVMGATRLKLVENDGWLESNESFIQARFDRFEATLNELQKHAGGLVSHASSHFYQGLHKDRQTVTFREWAPKAQALSLVGDFNDWNPESAPLTQNESTGMWEVSLPANSLSTGQSYKLQVTGADGHTMDRLPSHARELLQNEETNDYSALVSFPQETRPASFQIPESTRRNPLIYEAHIGMAGEEERVHSYREFADEIIPHIAEGGYNVIQLMAVAEHPYYGSFGYHVSNFFAPSSRFGSPQDLRYLVDKAHEAGLTVLMDLVHSHSVKNLAEGLNNFDGSGGQYFHAGEHGEVRHFLLSNLRYWLEEFHFDGFRFDGVTSMLYWHRGTIAFDNYDKYFQNGPDEDCILYLQLATTLIKELRADALIIAEDMSGMPGLCRPVNEGGVGFTHRLAMGIPDYWIKLLKEKTDEQWDLEEIFHTLNNRRHREATIAYAESHDQALVGDKTLAFRLMDAEMYWHMNKGSQNLVIDRGIALHKLIRLITLFVGGEGYLTFMGNEFGHPEWVDFPREGNEWSYKHCRRQWSLATNEELRYVDLLRFDRALLAMASRTAVLAADPAQILHVHNGDKVIIMERNNTVVVINFHHDRYYDAHPVTPPNQGQYELVLNSDEPDFGGHGKVETLSFQTTEKARTFRIPLPPRSAQVYQLTSS